MGGAETSLPPLPRYRCGNCDEQFGSNCVAGDISCPECEAKLCPHCGRWFGGDCDGGEDDTEHAVRAGDLAEPGIAPLTGAESNALRVAESASAVIAARELEICGLRQQVERASAALAWLAQAGEDTGQPGPGLRDVRASASLALEDIALLAVPGKEVTP
jgi:hypothetical protein